MYSDSDLESAIKAGAIDEESVARFRSFMASQRSAPSEDEESFRLLTGFNDIFVSICLALTIGPLVWLNGHHEKYSAGISLAIVSWLMAEYFTRRRRMALPSILLLLSFVGGMAYTGFAVAEFFEMPDGFKVVLGSLLGSVAAWFHWKRFQVPITVAIGASAILGMIIGMLLSIFNDLQSHLNYIILCSGIILFGLAMKWDLSDVRRITKRTDIAFWLHLVASPAIAHSVFNILGVTDYSLTVKKSAVIIALYMVFALVSLIVDRRALLVSSLFYVLYAANMVISKLGADSSATSAVTGIIIGSGLLLLSALWSKSRQFVLRFLPASIRANLTATRE